MRNRLAVLGLVLVALGAAGCGGVDDAGGDASVGTREPAERSGTLKPQEWAQRVERLCAENRSRSERAVRRLRREAAAKDYSERELAARVLEASPKVAEPAYSAMAALPGPEGKEREAARFIALLRKTSPLLEESARALRSNDRAAGERVNREILEVAYPARALARDLSIEGCIPG